MELIKSATRRTRLSEVVYIILNLAYAGLILLAVNVFTTQGMPPLLAFLVVILSKWRVIAVRPRFWFANLQTNMVDLLLGFSVVTLLWIYSDNLPIQIVITLLFAVWLVFIKPRSKRIWVIAQAGIVQFVGLTALFSVAHEIALPLVVLLGWLIGYITAHHALGTFDEEKDQVSLSLIWGFCIAELSWIGSFWTIAYPYLPGSSTNYLKIPQIAIVISLLSYLVYLVYKNYRGNNGQVRFRDVRLPFFFVMAGLFLMLVVFNGIGTSSF